ncbi:ATP-grasp domain-containing protein [Paraconexibacter algicola]|uniref:Prokaryotic glutathione synthetase ATP-binding domain-containing protein n=1 Tax=Paraconexibacter algicola TaxID=2133960 RepID=A0A2T4UCH7_9ACTN|nr:hypothetical protein [Paraconexibacter algicola]PTL54935.1 hypothetical protein C7Y72_20400 [Paraconexibacter algicola]
MAELLLASCAEFPRLDPDSTPLLPLLHDRGVACRVAAWDDPQVDWADADAVLVRSTWDYVDRRDAFVAWADRLEDAGVRLWPGADLVTWNTEKSYLRGLEAGGIRTLPTVWAGPQDDPVAAVAAVRDRGWDDVVAKPVVGAGASGLRRFTGVRDSQSETLALIEHVRELARSTGGAMLQPYLPAVAGAGETSVFFCEGALTHAVRKTAAEGDFRVQVEHGGTATRVEPGRDELDLATLAVAAVAAREGTAPLIARVDLVPDLDGRPGVIEVELIEPCLFLGVAPDAAATIADAIARRLGVR